MNTPRSHDEQRADFRRDSAVKEKTVIGGKKDKAPALGIVTRMGHDLGHGCEAIEPGPAGKRLASFALHQTKKADKYATKTVAKTTR